MNISGQMMLASAVSVLSLAKKTDQPRNAVPVEYGYIVADGRKLPPEYLVRITSLRNWCTIIGILQEEVRTRVESRWDPFVPTAMLAKGNVLLQAISGGRRSLITKATSRRVWAGSSPMILSLNLKFQAIEDSLNEVVEPCRLLQSIALPSEPGSAVDWEGLKKDIKAGGIMKAASKLPALGPPGPSPFTLEGILNTASSLNELTPNGIKEGLKGGDKIRVEIGRFLAFDNVIVKEVSVAHHVKPDPSGNPISANVNMIFETYEMMTTESLKEAYNKNVLSKSSVLEEGKIEHITNFGS